MYVSPIKNYSNYRKPLVNNQNFQGKLSNVQKNITTNIEPQKNKTFLNKLNKRLLIILIALAPIAAFRVISAAKEASEGCIKMETPNIDFSTQESVLNYSIDKIADYLKTENKEYGIIINNNRHDVISETLGTDSSVTNLGLLERVFHWATTPNYSYTVLHGHPTRNDGGTNTFSHTDFKTFVNSKNCSAMYVINEKGQYCRIEKTKNFKKPSEKELDNLEKVFDDNYYWSWQHRKTVLNKKGEVITQIIDYPGMHNFMSNLCSQYGMKYVTTFGTYGLFGDIYKDDYINAFNEKLIVVD